MPLFTSLACTSGVISRKNKRERGEIFFGGVGYDFYLDYVGGITGICTSKLSKIYNIRYVKFLNIRHTLITLANFNTFLSKYQHINDILI